MHSLHAASLRYPSSTSCSWSSISASFACLVIIAKLICLSFVHSKTIFSCFTLVVSPIQKASLIEKSRQKPQERIKTLTNAVGNNSYDHDPVLAACGIYVEKTRVLEPPKLKVGKNDDCFPNKGR
ncbi:Protein argonaute [Arachis hypogaea]|nr:Protein argonaute [Arachis hypogaea]